MTAPSTVRSIYIKIGDGASPEVFTHDCTINSARGIQFQSNGQDVIVPDCADPEAPAWRTHYKTGLSATITGSGKADVGSVDVFDDWFRADTAKNIKIYLGTDGYWSGAFKLTDLQWSGDPTSGQPVEFTCTMQSHGTVAAYT